MQSKVEAAAVGAILTPQAASWDVFVSHSSMDKGMATRLGMDLESLGQRVWIDYENLFVGDLLPQKIGEAIRGCSAFVLLWSASTDQSRWVPQEIQAALAVGHAILLCRLDATPYDHHPELADRFWCNLEPASYEDGLRQLVAALMRVLGIAKRKKPGEDAAPAIAAIYQAQEQILAALDAHQHKKAATQQAKLDPTLQDAVRRWPLNPDILSLAGYHRKNAVRIRTRDVRSKLVPKERQWLDEGASFFQRALAVDPLSINALNGLASIEATRGNLEMAEHYCLRALHEARRQSLDYEDAKEDLAALRAARLQRAGSAPKAPAREGAKVKLGASGSQAMVSYVGIAAAIPEERRLELVRSLSAFASHLARLGLAGETTQPLRIEISADAPYEAAYDAKTGAITMKPVWIHDPSVVFREYTHHALLGPAHKGEIDDALESGLADYLACSFAEDPVMGKVGSKIAFGAPRLRDLNNQERMDAYGTASAPQHRGQVWGGAFWKMRAMHGAGVMDSLLAKAWLAACAAKRSFKQAFVSALLREAEKKGLEKEIGRELRTRRLLRTTRKAREINHLGRTREDNRI